MEKHELQFREVLNYNNFANCVLLSREQISRLFAFILHHLLKHQLEIDNDTIGSRRNTLLSKRSPVEFFI